MADNRLARELENRDATLRQQLWTPPTTLPGPKPQDGWVFRWIRTAIMGQNDPTNASAKFREGWIPVKAEDHPELMIHTDTQSTSRFKDNIEVGGLVLCKAPVEVMKQRDAYYARHAQSQMEAVDNNYLRQEDKSTNMSLFKDRKSDVTFGRGGK